MSALYPSIQGPLKVQCSFIGYILYSVCDYKTTFTLQSFCFSDAGKVMYFFLNVQEAEELVKLR